MIEIDPQDRLLHSTGHKRPVGTIISLMLVAVTIFGAGIFYWVFVSQKFADVYKKLNIAPLPINIELRPEFYSRLDQLKREPCYRDAAIGLSDILLDAGYPRESATSILAFAERCGSKQNETILERAYVALNEVSDFSAAFKVVDQLVNSDPADAQYRYSRGATYEKLNIYSKALADYIAALQLSGTSSSPGASNVFYDISRMYVALGRYCDAIVPIETFISYKPAERRTPQTLKVISEYAAKGNCDANYARGVARVRFLGVTGVRTVVAVINGVSGNFLVDTGADYVSVTPEFSARAKIKIESSDRIPLKTVGGSASAEIGYASTVSLGSAEAQGVVIAIMRGPADPFGGHLDGLLGMNFLARFDFHFSQDAIELRAIRLRGSAAPASGGQLDEADAARERGDYGTARQLLRPLADQGSAPAQYNLGVLYAKGEGMPQDYAEARKWFRAAADQGHANAQYNLGIMYAEGQGVSQNYADAIKWFRVAAAQGHVRAQHNLGVQYLSGQGVPQSYAESVKWFRLAADKGNADSQYNLGFLYDAGQGVSQNYAEAIKWYRLAADQGYASAQSLLGVMYNMGHGVPQNFAEAVKWYRLAADQGYASAQSLLGVMYEGGQGVQQDYAEAAKWYRLAAGQGHPLAQSLLGVMYNMGHGVPQNYAEALKWFQKAAEQGNIEAQYNLGFMYNVGQGVPQNFAEAIRWYRLAADQGYPSAQSNLGLIYATGHGVPQNFVYAYMLFDLSAAQGNEGALKKRDIVAKQMTPVQISEAQKLAHEWTPAKQPNR